jgi:hypothetical protein
MSTPLFFPAAGPGAGLLDLRFLLYHRRPFRATGANDSMHECRTAVEISRPPEYNLIVLRDNLPKGC